MREAAARSYHHGDLKRVIIETAQNMLREEKGWQFTLREVARRAGVSHAAPYKHFPEKSALLAELAMIGFDELRAVISEVIPTSRRSPRTEFVAACHAYIEFGVSNPSLYRLMFSAEVDKNAFPQLGEAGLRAFAVLLDLLERGRKTGAFKTRSLKGQAAAAWSLLHGLTLLTIDGHLLPEKVGTKPIGDALNAFLEGLEA